MRHGCRDFAGTTILISQKKYNIEHKKKLYGQTQNRRTYFSLVNFTPQLINCYWHCKHSLFQKINFLWILSFGLELLLQGLKFSSYCSSLVLWLLSNHGENCTSEIDCLVITCKGNQLLRVGLRHRSRDPKILENKSR